MARAKKPRYEYIESKQLYRKRLKGRDGKTVALYGKTPQELSIKLRSFRRIFSTIRTIVRTLMSATMRTIGWICKKAI